LKISDLFFEEGFIKITGKGNKQRFVPIEAWLRNTSIFIKAPLGFI
jgi:integrase/recombinase XerD